GAEAGGGPTSFTNVDGLFAREAIEAGTIIMSEEEGCGMELPTSATPNCEVVEVED
ncbi:hypothetical protein EMIHUDRAFT_349856, partial [Emiliania huxleyi CCMP1516]|uniref:Uncharacterized protein n=2 Tax=Emiliania huxleyi TaxID=2903 RepID=A0A0D3J3N8_EMIH1